MGYKGTIIIPCYNKEHSIENALNSVASLSRFKDFEVIVIDDCSKDNSFALVEEFASKHENVIAKRFEQGSGSASKPRNTGIDMSTTDYLIFMDPDDKILNDGYSLLLTKMEEYKSDILIATRIGVSATGERIFTDFIDKNFSFVNQNNYSIKLDLLSRRPFILKTIYSKKLLDDHNIRFNENLLTSEDEVFDTLCAAYAEKITKIDDIVYQYTVDSQDSITTGVNMRMYTSLYETLVALKEAYKVTFSDALIAERLSALLDVFYINRIAFFDSYKDVETASEVLYDAVKRFGFENFDELKDRKHIALIEDLKNKTHFKHVEQAMLNRINDLRNRNKRLGEMNERLETTLNRKMVKPVVLAAKGLTKVRKKALPQLTEEKKALLGQLREFKTIADDIPNNYWVFMDRYDNAKDNGEALYRYVMNNRIHDKLAFVLEPNSIDYDRLKNEGFNVIPFNSLEHWKILKNAEYLFTSHCDDFLLYPWLFIDKKRQIDIVKKYSFNTLYKLVFLQHGVIRSNLSDWLGSKAMHKFITSSKYEADSILNIPHYNKSPEQVALTGLPRWDYLKDNSKNIITLFPTWRREIVFNNSVDRDSFVKNTPFFKNWIGLCESNAMRELADNYTINFVTHHDNVIMMKQLKEGLPEYINLIDYNQIKSFSEIASTSKALITDYSSFSFDFLFLNKPVIYFDFEKNALNNNVAGMEYDKYGYYCTELSEAEAALETLENRDFRIEDKYRENIEDMFTERSGNHCQRVIEATLE